MNILIAGHEFEMKLSNSTVRVVKTFQEATRILEAGYEADLVISNFGFEGDADFIADLQSWQPSLRLAVCSTRSADEVESKLDEKGVFLPPDHIQTVPEFPRPPSFALGIIKILQNCGPRSW